MSKLRKEFVRLVEEIKKHGPTYNDIAREIDMPEQVMYNARKGRSAVVTSIHINLLREILKAHENEVDIKALRAVNKFESDQEVIDLRGEVKEVKKELSRVRAEMKKILEFQEIKNSNEKDGKKNQMPADVRNSI